MITEALMTLIDEYDAIYVSSDLLKLPAAKRKQPDVLILELFKFLAKISKDKSVFMPTATLNLCNTNFVFDALTTPSYQMGTIAEIYRKKHSTIRSNHPLWSHCGSGPIAKEILSTSPPNAYGAISFWDLILQKRVLHLGIGTSLLQTPSVVHHAEQTVGVPYRFCKLFRNKVCNEKNEIKEKLFTMYVIRDDLKVIRDGNIKLCQGFDVDYMDNQNSIIAYDLNRFYEHLIKKITSNPLVWVKNEAEVLVELLKSQNC